jgi:hypothetical protein
MDRSDRHVVVLAHAVPSHRGTVNFAAGTVGFAVNVALLAAGTVTAAALPIRSPTRWSGQT